MRIAGAVLDGADDTGDVVGELLGPVDDLAGEEIEGGQRDGTGVPAGFEGVEVARRGPAATAAELVVAVGPAAGVAAHGPVAAAGHWTAGFVRVAVAVSFQTLVAATGSEARRLSATLTP